MGLTHEPAMTRRSAEPAALTIIESTRGWRTLDLPELWRYRELLLVLVGRDLKVRYKQTVLGVLWALLQPVVTMILFSVVFGRLASIPSDGYPYPVFVYAALLPWTFFSGGVSSASGSVVGSMHLVNKVYFPRLLIPMASIGSGLVDFAISALVLLGLMVYYGIGWSVNLLLAPVLVVAVVFTSLGVGIFLAALNVTYRDFRYVIPFLLQFWLFATPVVYPLSIIPETWQWLAFLNPMTGLIQGFRSCFLGMPIDVSGIALSALIAGLAFVAGALYFANVERKFADVI